MSLVVRAAGGVVVRDTEAGPRVLLVHRAKYDDWTFPKGKAEDGESWAATRAMSSEPRWNRSWFSYCSSSGSSLPGL